MVTLADIRNRRESIRRSLQNDRGTSARQKRDALRQLDLAERYLREGRGVSTAENIIKDISKKAIYGGRQAISRTTEGYSPNKPVIIRDNKGRVISASRSVLQREPNIIGKRISSRQSQSITGAIAGKISKKDAQVRIQRERYSALEQSRKDLQIQKAQQKIRRGQEPTIKEFLLAKYGTTTIPKKISDSDRAYIEQFLPKQANKKTPIILDKKQSELFMNKIVGKFVPFVVRSDKKFIFLQEGGKAVIPKITYKDKVKIIKYKYRDKLKKLNNSINKNNIKGIINNIKNIDNIKNKYEKELLKYTVEIVLFNWIKNVRTLLTPKGLYDTLRVGVTPILGVYKSIDILKRDIKLSSLEIIVTNVYKYYKPKGRKGQSLKNYLYKKLEEARTTQGIRREKAKEDILNAMAVEGMLLGFSGVGKIGKILGIGKYTDIALQKVGTAAQYYATAKAIIKPTPQNLGEALDISIINKISNTDAPIKIKNYFKRIKDPINRQITENIWKIGKYVGKTFKKTKLKNIEFDEITKNKYIKQALTQTTKETGAVLYGSKLEYEAKIEYLRKTFTKLYNKKYTREQTIKKFNDITKELPKSKRDSLLEVPKDLDFVIPTTKTAKLLKYFNEKYRYIPEILQKYLNKKGINELGIKILRNDKTSVFSILSKKQIDDLLKGLSKNGETTVFKILFLEKLYKIIGRSKKGITIIKSFKLEGSGLESNLLDFKLDLHGSNEVAFTRKLFLIFNNTEFLPLETPTTKNFKQAIIKNRKLEKEFIKKKEIYIDKLTNKISNKFKRVGLTLNKEKFKRGYIKLIDKLELTNDAKFDFLENKKENFNKKNLKTYREALDFIALTTKWSIADVNKIQNEVKVRYIIETLLNYAKGTVKTISELDGIIQELQQRREILVYYSTKSEKAFKDIFKIGLKGFTLKEKLNDKEQKLLIQKIEEYNKKLQSLYTNERLENIINNIKFKEKGLIKYDSRNVGNIDLGKTIDRTLSNIKGFKTEGIKKTKNGIYYITISEQIKRRTAGAISTLFEGRRAKDIKKLYNDLKLIELNLINIQKEIKKANPIRALRLKLKFRSTIKSLERKIKKINEIAKIIESQETELQETRAKKIYNTKGQSETTGFEKIELKNILNDMPKKTKNEIARDVNKYKKGIIKRQQLQKNIKKNIAKNLTKLEKYNKKRINSILKSLSSSIFLNSLIRSIISTSKSGSRSTSKSTSKSGSRSISKSTSKSGSRSISKSTSKSGSRSISKSTSKSGSRSISKSTSKSGSKSTSISKITTTNTKIINAKLPKLTWNTKIPKGYVPKANYAVRIRGSTRLFKTGKTTNRAIKEAINRVDKTTARSFNLIIDGITKGKDIKKPNLNKFRVRRGKDPRVLIFVEKSKYAIDSVGEKIGLRSGRNGKVTKKKSSKAPKRRYKRTLRGNKRR